MNRIILVVLAIAVIGCNRADGEVGESANVSRGTAGAADNTARNERDRNTDTRTPEDQVTGDEDRTITQHVRQGVVEEYGATAAAANVTIVTVDRVVTLRGPVNSENEQSTIGRIAQGVDRVSRVDNQLEVTRQ